MTTLPSNTNCDNRNEAGYYAYGLPTSDIARFMQSNPRNIYDFNFNGGALQELEVLGNPK